MSKMLMKAVLPFVNVFVEVINEALGKLAPGAILSWKQRKWLAFCLMGMMITNSVCWAKFERASLGEYALAALSWMLRHAKIPWDILLQASVKAILHKYHITEGILVSDDTEKKRAKVTKRIFGAHKMKDNKTGGYINGQSLVLLLLVTPVVTIPVGIAFYIPDPAVTEWYKEESRLKKQKVPKRERPPKPEPKPQYPTKQQLTLRLIESFKQYHPEIHIKLILTDSLYGTKDFIDGAAACYKHEQAQVISQLKYNQLVRFRNNTMSVAEYFAKHPGTEFKIKIRGGEEVVVVVSSIRLYVCSHKTKRFVVALKYENEKEYRYLVASDMSWRTLDIVEGHTFRWLVEVFFQDLKSYESLGQSAKQTDEEGSRKVAILSLLLDHCLFFHPDQQAQLENKLPAYTVGSLLEKTKLESLIEFIRTLVSEGNLQLKLQQLSESIAHVFKLAPSDKHMCHRKLGNLEAAPGLKHRAKVCVASG
jgi:hypothetical protein